MKVVRKTEMELGTNELKDARIGDILHIDLLNGVTAEFAVIGKDTDGADTITIQQITKCKISPFDRNDSNEYDGSDAQKYCTGEWLNNLPEGLRSRVVGIPFLLSKEEVKSGEKYPFYKDTRNWLKMNTDGEIDWWWTRSPAAAAATVCGTSTRRATSAATSSLRTTRLRSRRPVQSQ